MDLLHGKLVEQVTGNVSSPTRKVHQFLDYCDNLAISTIRRREYDLADTTVAELEEECDKLGFEYVDVVDAYFTVKFTRRGLVPVRERRFVNLRYQEMAASRAVVRELKEMNRAVTVSPSAVIKLLVQLVPGWYGADDHNLVHKVMMGVGERTGDVWSVRSSHYQNVLAGVKSPGHLTPTPHDGLHSSHCLTNTPGGET